MPPATSLSRSRPALKHVCSSRAPSRCASSSSKSKSFSNFPKTRLEPVKYPPEHPKYVYVPQPPQKQAKYTFFNKGVLPRPRRIFNDPNVNKTSSKFIAAAAPAPSAPRPTDHVSPSEKQYIEYKERQSAYRRTNLREGLLSLGDRKTKLDTAVATRSAQKQRDYERRIAAPERTDEYLTKATVLEALQPGKAYILPDPNLPQILAEKKAKHAIKAEEKMNERRNALHTLYVNAKNFIVSEQQLFKKIDEEFDAPKYKNNPGRGVFDIEGLPHTTEHLLGSVDSSMVERNMKQTKVTTERLKRIAEELTGGKIDVQEDYESQRRTEARS